MSRWGQPTMKALQEVLFTSTTMATRKAAEPEPASEPMPPVHDYYKAPKRISARQSSSSQRMTEAWAARQPDWFSVWPCPHEPHCQSWGICRDKRELGTAAELKNQP